MSGERSLTEREEGRITSAIRGTTIPEMFERQVQQSPHAPAIDAYGEEISFGELNQRANQLAHHLQDLGVNTDTLVGICLDRSPEMLIGILGILKAGGAYVPLDPGYPQQRLAYVLSDSQAALVLTNERTMDRLPRDAARLIRMDTDWPIIAERSDANLLTSPQPKHLAYVLYTSGSTGCPKGVAMPHAPLVNLLHWQTSHWSFPVPCRVLQFTSLNFDVSFQEIFSTWCSGGTVVLVSDGVRKDPSLLCRFISAKRIQRLFLPYVALKHLAEAGVTQRVIPECLREVITAGEQLQITPQLVEFFSWLPETTLENQYGPTETHVVTSYRLPREPTQWSGLPPIGKAIERSRILVLNAEKRRVPDGTEGELYLGGECLARGYYNRPELTNERFVWHDGGRERLYKTGDWGWVLPDGNIQFVGRIDHQVKIRGNRVELGEVEMVLGQHPMVQSVVAVARECTEGGKQLVTYIVSNSKPEPTASQLRAFLQEQLPDYAIPSAFIIVDALPLTPNGKIDRLTLQQQPVAGALLAHDFETQASPTERTLIQIWRLVLNVEHLGLHQNFFDLGGDSILSIRVAALARQAGIEFSMQQLAENPTIATLAKHCRRCDRCHDERLKAFELVAQADREKLPADIVDAYPMSALQTGMLFHSELDPESLLYHEIYTYRISSVFAPDVLQAAIDRLVARHPVLRTSFQLGTFTDPMQLVHKEALIRLQVEDLRHVSASEDTLQAAMEKEKETHFTWNIPPLLRFRVHWRAERRFDLIVCFHHAILDGWSLATMLSELLGDYLRLLKGEKAGLPSPSFKFAEFIAMEREVISSHSCRAFWQKKLADKPVSRLPMGEVKRSKGMTPVRRRSVPVSGETKAALLKVAQTTGVGLKTVLHAAHLRVLGILTDKSEVISGLSVDGRMAAPDAENTLGLFVNVVPVRIKFEKGSWLDLVRQVARAEQEILPLRRYPLSEIQRSCGGSLCDASFSFLRFPAYKSLEENAELRMSEGPHFEVTNFSFLATFQMQAATDELSMELGCDIKKIDPEIIDLAISCYGKVLHEMAFSPTQCHETFCSLLMETNLSAERTNEAVVTCQNESRIGEIVGARVMGVLHLFASYGIEFPLPSFLPA